MCNSFGAVKAVHRLGSDCCYRKGPRSRWLFLAFIGAERAVGQTETERLERASALVLCRGNPSYTCNGSTKHFVKKEVVRRLLNFSARKGDNLLVVFPDLSLYHSEQFFKRVGLLCNGFSVEIRCESNIHRYDLV